jgi:hypothetical protein
MNVMKMIAMGSGIFNCAFKEWNEVKSVLVSYS